ncbi:hypothetical protein B296_00050520 [Ensete ventricosum]|uniref:Beta-glucosidase n=1 Tax=Ensete ventricosum TaxID=4639 RepID=A0A426YII9_ENSVE|nr:hypothetical protein B296_00050520 [Ensete ventricosum]
MQLREDFTAFADVCFREFGDRVSQWTTIVEPNVIAIGSFDNAIFPPNRCSNPFGLFNCTVGDSTTEPYIAAHNFLLAHASVVSLYRTKYQVLFLIIHFVCKFETYLHKSLSSSRRKGANVKGYFVWSFLDVYEFLSGFRSPFGLYQVDFKDENRRRQPKLSALWYSDFLKKKKKKKTSTNINRMGLHETSHSQR